MFFFFFNLGGYKLIDVDEPRYAEAAREMIESRDWITPYFNYELRFDKPVFFYWLIALSYLAFGVTEFAARFPSALLASGLVFLTYYFGRTTISKAFGLISSLILVTSLEFIAMARMSITDMTLAFFICASIFAAMLAIFAKDSSKKYWWWLAYLASGLAVLTKGPVGFVLPAAIIGLNLILTGKLKESLNPKFIIPGFAIFALAVIPWYWAIISIHGNAFVEYFFIKHNVARFADSGFKQHAQPFYFYFIVLFAGFSLG
ncbi:MAG: glycosyltransferase family 39 protein [Ignavibacteriales bacterium]|nr:glycosyltransferase family 39 protein [Ignavibacteriales bacterium]